MKKIRVVTFILTLIICLGIPCIVYAQDYGTEYPDYIKYSGGAYIEVQSSIGRGSAVFQDTYKNGYLGFYGSGYNICNLSKTSISGLFVTAGGQEYNCRISSFGVIQYYYESGNTREWRDLNTTEIINTNVTFIDYTENKRDNIFDLFDYDIYKYAVVFLLFLCLLVLFFHLFNI